MIQTCYFTAFNHRSGQTVSLFIVVLVFVDVEKRCFLFALVLVHTTATSFWIPVIQCYAIFWTTATRRWKKQQAANPGPKGKEPRANRNVTDPNSVGGTFSG